MKVLLDKGADINAKDKVGWTALHSASFKGHTEVVKVLLDKGADINAKGADGMMARDLAYNKGYTEIVKLIDGYAATDSDLYVKEGKIERHLIKAVENAKNETPSSPAPASGQIQTREEAEKIKGGEPRF